MIWYTAETLPPPVAVEDALEEAVIVYVLAAEVIVRVSAYSPSIVTPPAAELPLQVTYYQVIYPPAVSVTVTVAEPEVVAKGLVRDTVARIGVISLYLPTFST